MTIHAHAHDFRIKRRLRSSVARRSRERERRRKERAIERTCEPTTDEADLQKRQQLSESKPRV